MKLRDLFVSIGFDVDDKKLKDLDRGLAQTKSLILALGAGAVAGAGLLLGLVRSVGQAGDMTAKTADKLGVQLEALQELRYAADLAGIAQNNFDTALQRMTRRAAEAAKGTGEAKEALRDLNVTVTDGQGRLRKAEDLLADIADGMARIEDPGRRVALAFKLFDTEGVGMVNMLAKGGSALREMRAEARSLGLVLTEQSARDAEIFMDELLRAKSVLIGIRNTVGAGLLPVFADLLVQFRQWVLLNREVIRAGLERFIRGTIALIRWLYRGAKDIVSVLADIVEMLGGLERVAKMAVWGLALLGGAYVLTAIGNLAMGIIGLTTAAKVFGNTAMVAWVKAAWLPLAIGAAIAALILIIQDLYTYFTGGKSVTGVIVEAFEKRFPRAFKVAAFYIGYFRDLIVGLNEFLAATIEYLAGVFTLDWGRMAAATERMIHAFDPLIERWKKLIGDAVDWVLEKLEPVTRVFNWVGEKLSGPFNAAKDFIAADPVGKFLYEDDPVGRWLGMGPSVSSRQDVRVNAPVTVTVPEGTPPAEVGPAIRLGISDAFSRMLRDASIALEPMVEN